MGKRLYVALGTGTLAVVPAASTRGSQDLSKERREAEMVVLWLVFQ
jgi:hypothetical protein